MRPSPRTAASLPRRLSPLVVLALAGLAAAGAAAARAEEARWEPEKTFALLVGVLEWEDKGLSPFPKEGRKDRELERRLLAAGVPRANVVFLEDAEATREAVLRELGENAGRSGEGTTLIIYYAGHGVQTDGDVYFANSDIDSSRPKKTGVAVGQIRSTLASGWEGSRLLLLADCCYSGALGGIVRTLDQDRPGGRSKARSLACLTSATASNVTTARWTFTETLEAAYGGQGGVDADRDGAIDFGEVDAYVHDAMRFLEGQLTRACSTGVFADSRGADFVLRAVAPGSEVKDIPGPWKVGQYVECRSKDEWYRAQVIDGRKDEWRVHYLGWGAEWDEWVPRARLRKPSTLDLGGGDEVEVEWKKKWYPAKVLKVEEDFALIHYDDYGSEWDEWVTAKRIRKR